MTIRKRRFALRPRTVIIPAVALLALLAAACGSSPTTAGVATTTTTTTLPTPVEVIGSTPVGSLSSIGPIFRLPVVPVAPGALVPEPTPTGVIGPTNAIKVGFRQIGSGPDLLLIMGQHGTMTWWDPQLLQALAGSYRVTIFDLPGIGYSQSSASAQTIDQFADVTAGLIAALGLQQTVVLGWGLGGQVAMELAIRHAGVASRLVLVDTGAGGSGSVSPSSADESLLSTPLATTAELSYLLFPKSADVDRTAWLERIEQVSPDDVVASGLSEEAAAETAIQHVGVTDRELASIKVPTLVVFGALDQVFPPANDTMLLAHIPRARKLELHDAGYASLFQDSPAFVTALQNFDKNP